MLNDATGFQKVFIITGRTDLRYGIDRLAATVEAMSGEKPLVPNTLYLFCGRRSDRIKGLVWERLSADFCYPHTFLPGHDL